MSETRRFATAALCIIVDKKLLLVRSRGKNAFYLPGGKIELGESANDAVCRELYEELTLSLDPASLSLYGTFTAQAYGEPTGVIVELHCFMGTYTGTIKKAAEIEEIQYVTVESYQLMPETAPAVVLLMQSLQKDGYIR